LPTLTPSPSPTPSPPPPATATATPCQLQFSDVLPDNPFYTYVRCLACRGIVGGYDTTPPCSSGVPCFLPAAAVTRGQQAKFVANAAGYDEAIPSTQQTFVDVPPGSPFWLYTERVALHGVISGYSGDGRTVNPCLGTVEAAGQRYFRPCNPVTRGQAARFVTGGFNDPIPSTQQTFADVPPSNPFWLAIERAALNNVISGYVCDGMTVNPCTGLVEACPGRYFRPCTGVTRGQTAKFISNVFLPACLLPQR